MPHTPGPWMHSDNGRTPIGIASEHRTWKDKPLTTIAVVGDFASGPAYFEETLANARLIAAAPDLLGLAKRLREARAQHKAGEDATESFLEIAAEANQIILKTEGE